MSLKNPVTPPEIDLGTVRLVAQRLNHYATPHPSLSKCDLKTTSKSKPNKAVEPLIQESILTNRKPVSRLCILIVSLCNLIVVCVFLLLSMYSYCSLCILIFSLCILNVVYVFLLLVYVFLLLSMYSYC